MKFIKVTTRKDEKDMHVNPAHIMFVRMHRDATDGSEFVVLDTTEAQLAIKEELSDVLAALNEC